MKKILFSDMDGTVIRGPELICPKDREAMYRLQKEGHLLAFCTGRNEQNAMTEIRRHDLPFDYLILNNGAHILSHDGKELFKRVIPRDAGLQILDYCKDIPDHFVYFYNPEKKMSCKNRNGLAFQNTGTAEIPLGVSFMEEANRASCFDIMSVIPLLPDPDPDELAEIAARIRQLFGDTVESTINTIYLDITPKGQTKGSGLKNLSSMLDKDVETYCIGDSFNDLSMFRAADHSFTFNRCDPAIRKEADTCVDYVYEVIEQYIL